MFDPIIFLSKNALLFFLLAFSTTLSIAQIGVGGPEFSDCDDYILEWMDDHDVDGLSMAIGKDGKMIYNKAFGFSDLAGSITTKPYNRFRLASVSKTMAGTAIMKLVEDGLLSLDDSVFTAGGVLGSHPSVTSASITDNRIYDITVDQLLYHTWGWNQSISCFNNPTVYGNIPGCGIEFWPLEVVDELGETGPMTAEMILEFALNVGLQYTPGTQRHYSNVGYTILELIVEEASGQNFEDYLDDEFFTSAEMFSTEPGKALLTNKLEREVEYITNEGNQLNAYDGGNTLVPNTYGGYALDEYKGFGGMVSSAPDLLRWLMAFDGSSTKPDLITDSIRLVMETQNPIFTGDARGWGYIGTNQYGFGGSLDGTTSFIFRSTSGGWTFSIIVNVRRPEFSDWNDVNWLPWDCINDAASSNPTWSTFDLLLAPTEEATALSTSVNGVNADISWTNGNGDRSLVVISESSNSPSFPIVGSDYTANTSFGSGSNLGNGNYIVYNGTGSSVSIQNLDPNTGYDVRIFSFNKNSSTGNYAVYQLVNRGETSFTSGSSSGAGTTGNSGPGGISSFSNIPLWIDATQESFTNGQPITSISDRSGNANDLTGNSPVFSTNQIGGQPAFVFDGNDILGRDGIAQLNGVSSLSWIIVASGASGSQNGCLISSDYSSSNFKWLTRILNNNFQGMARRSNNSFAVNNGSFSSGGHVFANAWNMSTGDFTSYIDNTSTGSFTNANSTPGNHIEILFGRNSNNQNGYLNGAIAEALVYTEELNQTQLNIIQNHLGAKYSLTISDNKYSHGSTHGNQVAGIGQESSSDNHTDAKGLAQVRVHSANDLDDDEYLLWGHQGGTLTGETNELPPGFGSGQKLDREFVFDESGGNGVGTVTIVADLSSVSLGVVPEKTYLVFDADGNFANATDTLPPTSVLGNLYTYENVDASSGPYFTFINDGSVGDDCVASNTNAIIANWDQSEWTCSGYPDSTSNATIAAGRTRVVSGTESVNDLTISGTLQLSANSTLIVKGDLEVTSGGSVVASPSSTVIFRGSLGSQQPVTNNSGSTLTFGGISISNESGVRLLGDDFAATGGVQLNDGVLNNEVSNFTFSSDGSGQGHVARVESGSFGGSGNYIFERWIARSDSADWNSLGTTGFDTDVKDLDNEIFISGVPGADGYAASGGSGPGFISMWTFNNTTDSYSAVGNVTDAMNPGTGYEVFLGDNLAGWVDKAVDFQGGASDINIATTNIPVNSTGGGWNLVANPLPGFLDFSAIDADYPNIFGSEFWYYDADSSQYNSRGPNAFIPPGQGFWLNFSSGGSFNLSINPSTHLLSDVNSPEFFKTDLHDELKVEVKGQENPFGGAAYIRKEHLAFPGEDAYDLPPLKVPDSRAVNIWFQNGEDESMVNYFDPSEDYVEFPMTIESGMPGEYIMKFKGLAKYREYQCMNLVNEQTGEQIQLSTGASYAFTFEDDLAAQHYTLVLSKEDYEDCIAPTDAMNNEIRVFAYDKMIYADFFLDRSAKADINVYNILGEQVYSESQSVGYSRESIDLNQMPIGVYLVQIHVNGLISTKKVLLN